MDDAASAATIVKHRFGDAPRGRWRKEQTMAERLLGRHVSEPIKLGPDAAARRKAAQTLEIAFQAAFGGRVNHVGSSASNRRDRAESDDIGLFGGKIGRASCRE